jgi:hypothetical protein
MPKLKVTEPLMVGSRVSHRSDKNLDTGVVVWRQRCTHVVNKRIADGAEWSVHWANGQRSVYRSEDILIIPPKKMKRLIVKDIIKDAVGLNAEE